MAWIRIIRASLTLLVDRRLASLPSAKSTSRTSAAVNPRLPGRRLSPRCAAGSARTAGSGAWGAAGPRRGPNPPQAGNACPRSPGWPQPVHMTDGRPRSGSLVQGQRDRSADEFDGLPLAGRLGEPLDVTDPQVATSARRRPGRAISFRACSRNTGRPRRSTAGSVAARIATPATGTADSGPAISRFLSASRADTDHRSTGGMPRSSAASWNTYPRAATVMSSAQPPSGQR